MKSLKRLTASMLCAAMLISMLPTSAFALGEGEDQDPPVEVSASAEPSAEVSTEPSGEASAESTADPSATPGVEPTEEVSATPSVEPTAEPTPTPTPDVEPTPTPGVEPTPTPDVEPTTEPTPAPTASASPEGGADVDLLGIGEDDGEIEVQVARVKENGWKLKINADGTVSGSVELEAVPANTLIYTLSLIVETPKGRGQENYFNNMKDKGDACDSSGTISSTDAQSGFVQYRQTIDAAAAGNEWSLAISDMTPFNSFSAEGITSFAFTNSILEKVYAIGTAVTPPTSYTVGAVLYEGTTKIGEKTGIPVPVNGSASPAVLEGTDQSMSGASVTFTVPIDNTGGSTASIQKITITRVSGKGTVGTINSSSPDVEGDTCTLSLISTPITITAGGKEDISVTVSGVNPSWVGVMDLEYEDGQGGIEHCQVNLSTYRGTQQPVLTVAPPSWTFSDTNEKEFTTTNEGDGIAYDVVVSCSSGFTVVSGENLGEIAAKTGGISTSKNFTIGIDSNSPSPNGTATVTYNRTSGDASTARKVTVTLINPNATNKTATVHTFVNKSSTIIETDQPARRTTIDKVEFYQEGTKKADGDLSATENGTYTASLPSGVYNVYVNGFDSGEKVDLTVDTPATAKVGLYTVTLTSSGASTDPTLKIYGGMYTASENKASINVPAGAKPMIQTSTADTDTFEGWTVSENHAGNLNVASTNSTRTTVTVTSAPTTDLGGMTLTANFSTSTSATLVIKKNDAAWGSVQVTLTDGSGTQAGQDTTGADGKVTFNDLKFNTTYNVAVAGVTGTIPDLEIGATAPDEKTYDFYDVTGKTDNSTMGGVKFSDQESFGTSVTRIVHKGTTVQLVASANSTYSFKEWKNDNNTSDAKTNANNRLTNISAKQDWTAYFKSGVYSGSVGVTWNNGSDPGDGSEVTVKLYEKDADISTATAVKTETLKKDTTSASWTDLTAGKSYDVYVTVNGSDTVKYATTLGQGTGESADITIPLASAKATADGEGTVTLSATSYTDKATSGTTPATLWVVSGTEVTWTAAADANYKITQWDSAADTATTKTGTPSTAEVAYVVKFERMTAQLTLNFKEQPVTGSAAVHTFKGNVVVTDSESAATTNAVDGTSTTFTLNVGETYTISVGGVDISDTVSPADETALSKDITWYEVKAVDSPVGKGFVAMDDAAIATQPAANGTVSGYYLPTETVHVAAGVNDTNYEFTSWAASTGTLTAGTNAWQKSYTVDTAAATLTATFSRVSYSQEITVRVNGTGTNGLTVTADGNGTDPAGTTADGGKVTLSLKTADAPYTIKVTDTANNKVFVGTATLDTTHVSGNNDQLPALVLDFYELTVKTDNKAAGNTVQQGSEAAVSGATTSTVAYLVKTKTGTADAVKTNESVKVVAAPTTDYRFASWGISTGIAPTDTTGTIDTFTIPENAVILTANFQRQFTVYKLVDGGNTTDPTGSTADNGDYTATVAAPAGEIGTNTHPNSTGGNAQVDEGSYVTLSAPTPDEGYRFDKWVVEGGELSTKNNSWAEGDKTGADKVKTAYFKPTADNATIKAVFVKDEFTAKISLFTSNGTTKYTTAATVVLTGGGKTYPGTQGTGDNANVYTITGLPAGTGAVTAPSYTLSVDGYETAIAVTAATATKNVNMYNVVVKGSVANGTVTPTEVTTSNGDTTFTVQGKVGTAGGNVYVPEQAVAGSTVALTASAKLTAGDGKHYRLANKTTTATDSDLWTAANGEGTAITDKINAVNSGSTTYDVAAMTADVTITAHFVQQYKVTAQPANGMTTDWITSAIVGTTGTAAFGYVDAGGRMAVTMTPASGMRLKGWAPSTETATALGEKVYQDGSETTGITEADGFYKPDTGTTVYVQPVGDLVMEATAEHDSFTAKITVKYNNAAVAGTPHVIDSSVKVYDGSNAVGTVKKVTSGAGAPYYEVTNLSVHENDGTTLKTGYKIHVNGFDTNVTFSAVDGGTEVTATVTLVKVSTAVKAFDGASWNDTTNDTDHSANVTVASYFTDSSGIEVYVPQSGTALTGTNDPKGVTVAAAVGDGFRLASTSADSQALWTSDPEGTVADANKDKNTFTFACPAADVVLTAHVVPVHTLTVVSGSNVGKVQLAGKDSPLTTTVDTGEAVAIKAEPKNVKTVINDTAFVDWSVDASGAGDFGTSAATADTTFAPTKDTTLTANFKNLQATTYKVGAGAETNMTTTGVAITVKAGYTAGDHTATVTIANLGNADTGALTLTLAETAGQGDAFGNLADSSMAKLDKTTGTATIDIPINGSLSTTGGAGGNGIYTATLTVTDNGVTIDVPVTLTVSASDTFDTTVRTFVDVKHDAPSATTSEEGIETLALKGKDNKLVTAKSHADGVWTFEKLPTAQETYKVVVNGYETSTTVNSTHYQAGDTANNHFDVDLITVRWAKKQFISDTEKAGVPSFNTTSGSNITRTADKTDDAVNPVALPAGSTINLVEGDTQTWYSFDKFTYTAKGVTATDTGVVGTWTVPADKEAVVLTAEYKPQFTVKIGTAVTVDETTTVAGVTAEVGKTSSSTWDSSYVLTGETDSADLRITVIPDGYTFKYWKVTPTANTDGTVTDSAQATATFTATKAKANETVTVTPVFYKDPVLSIADGDEVDNTTGVTYNITKDSGDVVLTFTKNDAGAIGDLKMKAPKADSFGTPVANTAADVATGKTFTISEETLKKMTTGTYTFEVLYTQGAADTDPNYIASTESNTVTLTIKADKLTLKTATIKVADNNPTANLEYATTDRHTLNKVSVTEAGIRPTDLTWTWYASAVAPTAEEIEGGTLPTGAAKLTAASGGTEMTGESIDLTQVTAATVKGKYVFALVETIENAETVDAGKVLTNAIPVDYDASVKIKEDAGYIAAGTGYKVKLVQSDDASKEVELSWETDAFKTSGSSELTGGKSYQIYVNAVEGDTNWVDSGATITPADPEHDAIQFWTVNFVDFTHVDAEDNSSTPQAVGETFDEGNMPGVASATATVTGVTNGVAVTNEKAVLNNTSVKFLAENWTQDYTLTWQTGNTTTLADTATTDQALADATTNTGYTQAVTAKLYVGGELNQKLYTIVGDIKAEDGGQVAGATLAANGYTFDGTLNPTAGGNGATVTFKVPKSKVTGAITTDYTLAAVGATNPPTTILGYAVPAATTLPVTSVTSVAVTADANTAFTIFAQATKYTLEAKDTESSPSTATGTSEWKTSAWETKNGTVTVTDTWALNYAAKTYTVNVTNKSNTDLKNVALSSFSPALDGKITVAGVGLTNATKTFDLAKGASKQFTVTFAQGLDADTYTVPLAFTSKMNDGTTAGPGVTYTLKIEVQKAKITDTQIGLKSGTSLVPGAIVEKQSLTVTPAATYVDAGNPDPDVEYKWYVTDSDATPDFTTLTAATDGVGADGKEYTIQTADAGKYLWMVAQATTGSKRLEGYAAAKVEGTNVAGPMEIPYTVDVKLWQDEAKAGAEIRGAETSGTYAEPTGYAIEVVGTPDGGSAPSIDWNEAGYYTVSNLYSSIEYKLNVTAVQGDANKVEHSAISNANIGTAIDVIYHKVLWTTDIDAVDAYEGMTATGDMLADTDKDIASATAAVGTNSVAVSTSGTNVVDGTVVTFKSDTWDKDYTLDWLENTTELATGKTSAEASGTGHAVTYDKQVGTINAKLNQKKYNVVAHAMGTGSLSWIALTDGSGNIFTTNTTNKAGILALNSAASTVNAGSNATFSVPFVTGGYKVSSATANNTAYVTTDGADGTTGTEGILYAYDAAGTMNNKTGDAMVVMTTAAADAFGIVLEGSSWSLQVAGTGTKDEENTTGDKLTTSDAATDPVAATYVDRVTRNYGWTADTSADKVTVTLTNVGNKDLYKVTLGDDTVAAPFTLDLASSTFKDNATPTMKTGDASKETSFTVSFAAEKDGKPLPAGDHELVLTFQYATEASGAIKDTQLTYKLILTVNQATLETVTVKDDSGTPVVTPALTTTAVSEVLSYNDHTTDFEGVKAPADELAYQWYRVPHGTAAVDKDSVKTSGTAIGSATSASYTVAAADEGYDLYLLLSAKNGAVSVKGSALSTPVAVNYTGKVKITEDGTPVESVTAGTPEYAVVFQNKADSSDEVSADWNDTDDVFTASLKAGVEYKVLVNRVKGDTATAALIKQDTGLTVKSDNIAGQSNEATVPFFSVSYEDVNAGRTEHYKTGTGEAFDSGYPEVQAKMTAGDGTKDIATGDFVLEDSQVTFTTKATWTQDYDLTWQEKLGEAADYSDTTTTQNATDATNTGLANVDITQKTAVTAKLKQNTYTVTGTIKTEDGATSTGDKLSEVTMKATFNGVEKTFTTKVSASANEFTTGTKADNSPTVTFTVPKGTYTIAATAASGTTVVKMRAPSITGTDVTGSTLTGVSVDAAAAKTYDIVVQTTAAKLEVTDGTNKAESTTNTGTLPAAEKDDVRYFAYTAGDPTEVTLNNLGNNNLNVSMKVEKSTDGSTWTTLYDGTTKVDKTIPDGKITITLSGFDGATHNIPLTAASGTVATDTAKVGTIAVAAGMQNPDDVQYKFTFTSKDADNNADGPSVVYIYDLEIKPLTITSVTVEGKDGANALTNVGVGNTAQLTGKNTDNIKVKDNTATTAGANTKGLTAWATDSGDFKYQWFTADTNDVTADDFDFNSYTPTAKTGSAAKKIAAATGDGATTNAYTAVEADMGKYLYLVVYASGADANAESFAVSAPIATQFMPKVKVAVDGTAIATTDDPGYTLYLAEDGSEADAADKIAASGIALAWDGTAKAYRPGTAGNWTSIDPTKTYNVWAQNAKGTGSIAQIETGVTFAANANPIVDTVTVDYYTVNFEGAIQVSNTSADVTSALKGSYDAGLAATVGSVTLADGAPVLKNQKVTFTMTANQDNTEGTPQSWDEAAHKAHYTAGWTGAGISDATEYAYPPDGNTLTKEVTVSAAGTAGTADSKVTATLTQKLYTVTFTIEALDTGKTAKVDPTLTENYLTCTDAGATSYKVEAKSITSSGAHGGVITYEVPAGAYTVTTTPASGSILEYYKEGETQIAAPMDLNVTADAGHTVCVNVETFAIRWDVYSADGSAATAEGVTSHDITGLKYGPAGADYGTQDTAGKDYQLRLYNSGTADLTGLNVKAALSGVTGNKTNATTLADDYPITTGTGWGAATLHKTDDTTATVNLKDVNGFTLPVGGYVTFAMTVPVGRDAGDHAVLFQVDKAGGAGDAATVNKLLAAGNEANHPDFAPKYTVTPATITKVKVNGITAPVKDANPDTTAALVSDSIFVEDLAKEGQQDEATFTSLEWYKPDGNEHTGGFDAGTAYTAKVTLTAKDLNYNFDVNTYKSYYQLLDDKGAAYTPVTAATGTDADGKATLTLAYTFPATAGGALTVSAHAIDAASVTKDEDIIGTVDKVRVATPGGDQDIYYVVTTQATIAAADQYKIATDPGSFTTKVADGNKKTVEPGVDGNILVDINANTASLNPGTTYYVHAISVGANTTVATDTSLTYGKTSFRTPYKVTVKVQDTDEDQTAFGDVQSSKNATLGDTQTVYINAKKNVYDADLNVTSTTAAETFTVTAKPVTNYFFNKWTVSETTIDGTATPDGAVADANTAENNTFTVADHDVTAITITAVFKKEARLEYSDSTDTHGTTASTTGAGSGTWDIRSTVITEGYTDGFEIARDATVKNAGSGPLNSNATFIVTLPTVSTLADAKTSSISNFLDASFVAGSYGGGSSNPTLTAGGFGKLSLKLKAGLRAAEADANSLPGYVKTEKSTVVAGGTSTETSTSTYQVRVWVYDSGDDAVWDYVDITVAVGDSKKFNMLPSELDTWDLNNFDDAYATSKDDANSVNPAAQTPNGIVQITPNGFTYHGGKKDDWNSEPEYQQNNDDNFIVLKEVTPAGGSKKTVNVPFSGKADEGTAYTDYFSYGKNAADESLNDLQIKGGAWTATDPNPATLPLFLNDAKVIEALGTDYKPKAGDVFEFTVTLHNDSGAVWSAPLKLTFTDTTPKVESATLTADANQTTLTVAPTVTRGVAGQPDIDRQEVVVKWYEMKETTPVPASDTLIQGPHTETDSVSTTNALTYTVQPTDAGKKIYAVVTGDVDYYATENNPAISKPGTSYKGSVTTDPITINYDLTAEVVYESAANTYTADPARGTISLTDTTLTSDGYATVSVEAKAGYIFDRWQVKGVTNTDSGAFGDKTTGTATTTTKDGEKFYPAKTKVVLQAVMVKVPVLGIEAKDTDPAPTTAEGVAKNYTYDYGQGAINNTTEPELVYDKNQGSGSVKIVIKPADPSTMKIEGEKTTGWVVEEPATIANATGVIKELTKADIQTHLGAGTYTVTYLDKTKGATATSNGNAAYDVSVTLIIKNTQEGLPPVNIIDDPADDGTPNYAALTEVTAGDDLDAFFYDVSTPTDPAKDKAVSTYTDWKIDYSADDDNAAYQWYYGPDVDPTTTAGAGQLTAISGATGKTCVVTDALVDTIYPTAGETSDKYIYVKATAKEGTDYDGTQWSKVKVERPAYTVTVNTADGNTTKGSIKITAPSPAVGPAETGSKTVTRRNSVSIEAIPALGYVFDYWEVDGADANGDSTVDSWYGAFGSFQASVTTDPKTSSKALAFFPNHDAVVTAHFKLAPTYNVSVDDKDAPEDKKDFGVLYTGVDYSGLAGQDVDIKNPQDAQTVKAETKDEKSAFTVTFTDGNTDFTTTGKAMGKNDTATGAFTVKPLVNGSNKLVKGIGEYTATITVTGAQDGTATYTATYAVSAVGTKDIDKPTNGGSPDFTATVLDDPRFDIQKDADNHDVTWTTPDGSKMGTTDKFEPTEGSEKYKASVTIKFDDGTPFPDVDIIRNYAPTFNGEPATAGGPVTVVRNGDGTITITREYTITASNPPSPGPSGPSGPVIPEGCYPVYYWIGLSGQTSDPTIETVEEGKTPVSVPTVTPLEGYRFLGWSDTDPAKLKKGEEPKLVDPTKVKITGDTTFYAVYSTGEHTILEHTHYVIGFPDGTFGPDYDITRGSVATIIARACLDGFVEGANYGNPGGYSDVNGHWASSAIAFCSMHGVFQGYDNGTFRPDKPISRQEFALVIARLAGLQSNKGTPFNDAGDVSPWAADGVYTVYANGWINGYEDGSFRPLRNIRRSEAVKILNGYLNRGVDAEGLSGMTEYVHNGVASNNTEDGHKEYMTWPDVPKGHWAYYEIIEAANDHTFYFRDETNKKPPETWDSVKIDERWRYHDDANDGPQG